MYEAMHMGMTPYIIMIIYGYFKLFLAIITISPLVTFNYCNLIFGYLKLFHL